MTLGLFVVTFPYSVAESVKPTCFSSRFFVLFNSNKQTKKLKWASEVIKRKKRLLYIELPVFFRLKVWWKERRSFQLRLQKSTFPYSISSLKRKNYCRKKEVENKAAWSGKFRTARGYRMALSDLSLLYFSLEQTSMVAALPAPLVWKENEFALSPLLVQSRRGSLEKA